MTNHSVVIKAGESFTEVVLSDLRKQDEVCLGAIPNNDLEMAELKTGGGTLRLGPLRPFGLIREGRTIVIFKHPGLFDKKCKVPYTIIRKTVNKEVLLSSN